MAVSALSWTAVSPDQKPRPNISENMASREVNLTLKRVRKYWAFRQGLSTRINAQVAEVVRSTGWIYSAGSTLPYLAFRARLPGIDRAKVDRAIFDDESILEVPTVRGCTMLVPAEDVSFALEGGREFSTKTHAKVRTVGSVTDREVLDLSTAIREQLEAGPLSSDALRERLPSKLVRGFGSGGKKLGERSTLTYVLRLLQRQGIVKRVASDRRLDDDTFTYRLMSPRLLRRLSREEAENGLASRFFEWASPATLKEFSWWAGISQREARRIVDRLGLVSISVDGWATEAWIPEQQLEGLRSAKGYEDYGDVILLPFRDNYLYFRRGIGALLDESDLSAVVLDWMGRPATLGDLDSLHHNAIVFNGRLIGYWEYDPETAEIVWQSCGSIGRQRQRQIEVKTGQMQSFIRSQLNDVAFYAFDGGANRRQRIDSLR
jgi:hypothetical protein